LSPSQAISQSPDKVRIAWQIGELGYRLRNGQKRVRQQIAQIHARFIEAYLECTRRFGKSTYGLIWLSEYCIKNPGSVSAFFAPVKEGLKDFIGDFNLPDSPIGSAFKDCPEDLLPTLDHSLTLTFPNGSKIIFRGSNNQQHRVRRGNSLRRVYVDEARDVDDLDNLIGSVVIPSLFLTDGRLLIGSTPADTEEHPLFAIKQAAEKEGRWIKYDILEARRYDPDIFTDARIQTFREATKDPVAWQREYMALWVKDPTKIIIPEWNDAQAVKIERDEFFPFYHKYAALDSGVADKTAGLLGYYDFKQAKLVIEDEFVLQGEEVRTDRIAEAFKMREEMLGYQATHRKEEMRKLAQHERVFRRVADNDNLILVNDLNSLYGLDFFPTRKDDLPAQINLVREWAKNGRILVNPRCVELLGCLRNAIWDKNREKLAKSKTYGHFDALMALVYLVRNVDTHTNPIPVNFGKSWATHAGIAPGSNQPNTSADNLARIFQVKTDRDVSRERFVKGADNGFG
jgi:hypothetical protein